MDTIRRLGLLGCRDPLLFYTLGHHVDMLLCLAVCVQHVLVLI